MVRKAMTLELDKLRKQIGDERFLAGKLTTAGRILEELMTGTNFHEFLTLDAYEHLA